MRFLLCLLAFSLTLPAQNFKQFIRVNANTVALTHVSVIDGTGAPVKTDQTIVLDAGRIRSVSDSASAQIPAGAETLDLAGHTVIPGLVGMHEHLFYPSGLGIPLYVEHAFSFPRLYLASGVTTARTAGGLEVQTDLMIKKWIDQGRWLGPELYITAGYLEGPGSFTPQMYELRDAADATSFVDYWAALGATSFKAYMHITRAELKAAIDEAHAKNLKVTGHLCSVTFQEAAAMGIDNLEHGIIVDGGMVADKRPDRCPQVTVESLTLLDIQSEAVQKVIRDLVKNKVAITSTLAVFEITPPMQQRFLDALTVSGRTNYMAALDRQSDAQKQMSALRVKKEVEFERAFVKAGGMLLAGADPTGNGSALAGFADQRNLQLLVAGGFTPVEAVQIATQNGAKFLGIDQDRGTIAVGKRADLAVIEGDVANKIDDIQNVRIVFKGGVGYDSQKLLDSIKGHVGLH